MACISRLTGAAALCLAMSAPLNAAAMEDLRAMEFESFVTYLGIVARIEIRCPTLSVQAAVVSELVKAHQAQGRRRSAAKEDAYRAQIHDWFETRHGVDLDGDGSLCRAGRRELTNKTRVGVMLRGG